MEFNYLLLDDCIDLIIDHRGLTPKKLKSDWVNSGVPVISAKNVKNGELKDEDSIRYIDNITYQKWMKEPIRTGDLLLASEGATLGENMMWRDKENIALGQRLFGIRADNKNLYYKYFAFYVNSQEYQHQIFSKSTGTSVLGIKQTELRKTMIKLPSFNIQVFIGNLGDNIQKKIILNKKIIANLEELSQTLFKRWFVDFEFPDENGNPYKSSGGEMIDSELGEIPEGWKIGHFSHFCKKPIAGDWGKEQKQGNYVKPVRVIRGADINDYSKGGKGKSPIRFILQKNFDNKKLISGDIIVEISGGSPTQSTGRTLLINNKVLKNSEYELVCTNFCKVIRPLDEKFGEWLAYYFNYLYFRDVFFNYENGTTGIKNLDYKSIMNTMKIIAPSTQILNNFHNLISKYKINIQYLGMENDYLTQLRDTLLPKLMSGELEIPDDIEVNEDELSI